MGGIPRPRGDWTHADGQMTVPGRAELCAEEPVSVGLPSASQAWLQGRSEEEPEGQSVCHTPGTHR